MSSSLSKLVDNLSEGIHNNKCFDCKSNLDYVCITKNEKLLLKCFNCNIYYKKKFNNDLIKKFKNTYSFCNNDTTESSSSERINISYLMSSSLSKLVDNLSEGIHNNKCFDCKSNLDYVCITKNEKLLLKCFNCNIYYKKNFNNDLIKKFKNTYSFCNNDTTESSSSERINISYLMSSSLSKLVDNLSEGIHNNKCFDCKSNLDYVCITKNEKLLLKCFNCNIYYKKNFKNDLIKKFKNTYSFCNNDTTESSSSERINKFVLLLRKGVYPYEYMDSWERFNEKLLPSKKDFYSNLNMEDINDIDYRHADNVFKRFKLKNLGDYHDLYVQRDTLLLADVFNNFRDMCIKEYELDLAHFLSLPGLAWQACLKKTNIELELLTDYDILLMVEEGIGGGICHSIHRYAKANNKYMKNYNNNEESSYIQYLDANNLYGWLMSKKLPVNGFKGTDNNKINEEFIKNYNENDKKGYIFEVDVKYPK